MSAMTQEKLEELRRDFPLGTALCELMSPDNQESEGYDPAEITARILTAMATMRTPVETSESIRGMDTPQTIQACLRPSRVASQDIHTSANLSH